MHPLDKAEKILSGQWPKNPKWIFESPDCGKTVYRRMAGYAIRQRITVDSKPVDTQYNLDTEYFENFLERKYVK